MEQLFILRDAEVLQRLLNYLQRLRIDAKKPFEVCIRIAKKKRSKPANKRYWAILRDIASQATPEGKTYIDKTWHEYFKGRFLGYEELELPNGKIIERPISTADMETGEFSDYMTQVEAWGAFRGVIYHDDYLLGQPAPRRLEIEDDPTERPDNMIGQC